MPTPGVKSATRFRRRAPRSRCVPRPPAAFASADMAVRVERAGPVTTVILGRPERRNAVDGATAAQLADAFRAFDADPSAAAAVLWGAGGTFCAGADLKAIASATGNRLDPEGDGPVGPRRMRISKPTMAAWSGYAVEGGLEHGTMWDVWAG